MYTLVPIMERILKSFKFASVKSLSRSLLPHVGETERLYSFIVYKFNDKTTACTNYRLHGDPFKSLDFVVQHSCREYIV